MPTVVTGLLAGLVATLPMTLWEAPFHRRDGLEAVLEWHLNQVLAAKMFDRPADELVLPGLLLHFGHGAVGGLVFAFLLPAGWGVFAVAAGLVYGWFLWLVGLAFHRPVTGTSAIDHPDGLRPAAVSLVGHGIYGVVLGAAVLAI